MIVAVIGAIASSYAASFLKGFFVKRRNDASLRIKIGEIEVAFPQISSQETLSERIEALARVSPRLAILDGWQLVAEIIRDRANINELDIIKNSDIITVAQGLPDIDSETLDELRSLLKFRNLVAHPRGFQVEDGELRDIANKIFPLVMKLYTRPK